MKITEDTKSLVIQAWLMGKSRETIASEFQISTGTVSNIVDQWRNMIGSYDANSLRELALGLKKSRISPHECSNSLRTINLMNKLSIDEDHLCDFLNKLYLGCKDQGVQPYEVAKLIKEINAFPEINSVKEIPRYIKKRSREKRKLGMEIYFAKRNLENLNRETVWKKIEIQDLQKDLESFKEMNRNEQKDFLLFKDLKNELEKNNISIQDFEQLINIITIFKNDFKYQPSKILNEFSGIQEYRRQRDNKNIELNNLEWNIQKLRYEVDVYKLRISGYQLEESALLDLQNMGFNLADLKKLYSSLQYVAQKYSIDVKEVKTKFFKIVDKFQDLFSLEIEIGEKETENDILDQKIISNREILKDQPETLSVLKCLVDTGFDENNILSVFQIFKKDFLKRYPIYLKTYLQDLSKDLDKYINIKNTLKNLHVQELLMKCRVDKLSVEKSHIENFIYSSFIVFYFMHISISIQHARMQKRFTEYLVLQYVVYLFFYNIVKKNLMVSKRKLKTRNKKTRKFQREKTIGKK